jgi:hypothetical protein
VPNEHSAPDRAELRFSELMRAMAKLGSDAALAVFFDQSVTTIANWCNAKKLPRNIDELVRQCGLSLEQLRSADEQSWQATIRTVLKIRRVLITPPWLHFQDHISFVEESTQAIAIMILSSDAHNDTQRLDVQAVVRKNISRGIDYIYVIPEGCQHERALIRFTGTISAGAGQGSTAGTAKILRIPTTKKTTRQWKRIDHVMLFAHGDVSAMESLSDILRVRIDEGYEQLYKAGDQPYGAYVWKTLSIREIDYYKELLEEWSSFGDDDDRRSSIVGSSERRHLR